MCLSNHGLKLRDAIRRRGDNRGAVAVEFALIAPIFLLMIVMTFELGLVLLTQSALDNAAQNAARLILTGQAQTGGGAAAFKSQLCADVGILIPCASLQYNVQAANSFSALNGTVTTDASGNMTGGQFSPGTPGQSVLVQVGYNRTYITGWVGSILGGGHNSSLLLSTVAFQNEPYQ